jgi:hypothetical protein
MKPLALALTAALFTSCASSKKEECPTCPGDHSKPATASAVPTKVTASEKAKDANPATTAVEAIAPKKKSLAGSALGAVKKASGADAALKTAGALKSGDLKGAAMSAAAATPAGQAASTATSAASTASKARDAAVRTTP